MAIRKRTDTKRNPWQVTWRERDRSQRSRSFPTRRDAQAFQAEIVGARARGLSTPPRASRVTVDEWLERWVRSYSAEWAATTLRQRAYACDRWVSPYLGSERLGDLSARTIRDYRSAIMADGVSAAYANSILRILSAALGAAAADDLLPANPCSGIRSLPVYRERARALTAEDVEAIRAELEPGRDQLIVAMMGYAGLRPAEVCGLQWRHVAAGLLHVEQSVQYGRIVSTKTRRPRSVPLLDVLADDLEAVRGDADAMVAPGDRGGLLDWHNWTGRVFRPVVRRLGLTVVPYDLRHTFASLALHEGRSLAWVSRALGHASQTTTLDHYSHLYEDAQVSTGLPMAEAIRAARAAQDSR